MVQWETWVVCTDAVSREAKVMIAIREGALVVVAPPGGSVSFTPDQLEQAEQYGRAIDVGVEMLRRQATQAARDRQQRARHERGWS